MRTVTVRHATAEDLPAVAAIYTHYVLRTTNTFNTEVRTPRQWRDRFEENVADGRQRLLVAEVANEAADGVADGAANRVTGFVETQRLRPKAAYDRSVELSVYVAPDATGAGVGSALYRQLLHELEADERFHRAYAIVALPNPASVRFHERWGFVHRGTLTEAGHKFGRYLDVAYFERGV